MTGKKRPPPKYEETITSHLIPKGHYIDEAKVPRPEGDGWRLVSHTVSVCSWTCGDYGTVLITYAWEREVVPA